MRAMTDLQLQACDTATGQSLAQYRSRQHTLKPPKALGGRVSLFLQNWAESVVARVSVLPDTPVYDPQDFPWVKSLESHWQDIRAELDTVMVRRDDIPGFHEIIKEVSTITADDSWKTFFLKSAGMDCSDNIRHCPRTMALLEQIPNTVTAFFSILAPGKHIPAHRGAYNGVLRLHLGLIVPEPQGACRIRVADQMNNWSEGKVLIFDDSFNHEIWNDTDGWRTVLFVDVARPLRQPWHWINLRIISLVQFAPFLRQAGARQKQWARWFYGDRNG